MSNVRTLRPTGPLGITHVEISDAMGVDDDRWLTKLVSSTHDLDGLGFTLHRGSGRPVRHTNDHHVVIMACLVDLHRPEPVLHPGPRRAMLEAVASAPWGTNVVTAQPNPRLTMHYWPLWDLPERIRQARTGQEVNP